MTSNETRRRVEYYEDEIRSHRQDQAKTKDERSRCNTECINFEQRLSEIEKIIRFCEQTVLPKSIDDANLKASNSAAAYRCAIVCTQPAADVAVSFKILGINTDSNSRLALEALKKEKRDTENKIAELAAQMDALAAKIDDISADIRACQRQIDNL